MIDLDGDDTEDEHDKEKGSIPPLGYLRVLGHQASVDISLFMHRATGLCPDLLAVEEVAVPKKRAKFSWRGYRN
jgi:hypothetical protein